jgi:hypothetical protein
MMQRILVASAIVEIAGMKELAGDYDAGEAHSLMDETARLKA